MRLAYLHLPRFPVQRRVLEQPSLRGRPVLLRADERGVQRVRFASGAALREGVRPGQSVAAASALVPEVVRLPYDAAGEARALLSLGEALLPLAPGFQVDAPEGLWLDASAAHLAGGEAPWAQRVLAACEALGLSGRLALAAERFTAQALARHSPDAPSPRNAGERAGVRGLVPSPGPTEPLSPSGVEGHFFASHVAGRGSAELLAHLPLAALEAGWLGPGAAAPFRSLGLTTLGEVAALPAGALVARFGAMGLVAGRLCRGEDDSRFVADQLPEVLEETVTLDWPAEHLEPLLFALKMVVDRLCARLQGRRQAAVRLTVTLGLEGSRGATESVPVPVVLARPSSQSKLLVELLRHRLTDLTVDQPIVSLRGRVDEACLDPGRQLMLGDAPAGEAELEVVLSRLQSALGEATLFSAEPAARHRPEDGWQPKRFRPPDAGQISDLWGVMDAGGLVLGERGAEEPAPLAPPPPPAAPVERVARAAPADVTPLPDPHASQYAWVDAAVDGARAAKKAPPQPPPPPAMGTLLARPARLFKEPALLRAELSGDGELRAVTLLGRRRRVESLWGPERLSGDWWSATPFARDYYRVQLEGVGVLWVYRDGQDGQFYAQGLFD